MCEKNTAREIMRDPIRYALTAQLCKKGNLALFAVLAAAYYAIVLKLCGAMQGAAVIALYVLICCLLSGGLQEYGGKWLPVRFCFLQSENLYKSFPVFCMHWHTQGWKYIPQPLFHYPDEAHL